MNPFTFFFLVCPRCFVNFGTPRWFHNCISNLNTNADKPEIVQKLSAELGIHQSAGLCVSEPQFTFETSHSTEFKSILSQDLTT